MKPTIAFVTGGYSGEAEISYKSAVTIEKNIDSELWNVYKIDIRPAGWFHELKNGKIVEVDKNDFSIIIDEEKITFDAVLMGMHGSPGEDGRLLGYFDMIHIPYTSCNFATSAITFNKRYTVAIANFSGIPVSKSIHLFKNGDFNISSIQSQLKFPVFVKPNNGGSSIGMSKVADQKALQDAVNKAFNEDDQVLIEEFISGREFTIGVYKSNGEIKTLPITEIITKKDFFDFEAKYLGESEEITPAQVSEPVAGSIRKYALKAYEVFNCRGVVRIDFIYNEENSLPYMLEINTVPGQSEASIIPQQVKAAGLTLKEFYTGLIEECLHSNSY
ncbi:MAG: D-alanine--D-alanine ligase [Ginsengibacter sp.]